MARAAINQAIAKGKVKRGRKRKTSLEAEAEASEPKTNVARMSKAQLEEDEEPWRAPVARMY